MFVKLGGDITPSVRRVAAQNIVNIMSLVQDREGVEELMKLFESISKDDQDSIRIQVVSICVSLPDHVKNYTSVLREIIQHIAIDKSWRVRWCLAHRINEIVKSMNSVTDGNNDESTIFLCSTYESLLNDAELEVRGAAVTHLADIAEFPQTASACR